MTKAEQALADDKMRAEILKLMAETAKINSELPAITAKLMAEATMLNKESAYYVLFRSMALGAAIVAATATLTKLYL